LTENGSEEIGLRGSICSRVLNIGAGGPGGVRLPWLNAVAIAANHIATGKTRLEVPIIVISVSLKGFELIAAFKLR
jgi:hypothetical protein